MAASRTRQLRTRVETAIVTRLSPEQIRRATLIERLTVRRMTGTQVERWNRWLAALGKLTTVVWVAFCASIVLGVEWKAVVQDALNSSRPIEGALALAIVLPTLAFVAARSAIGFARWRLQRELWRRDVERLSGRAEAGHPLAPGP